MAGTQNHGFDVVYEISSDRFLDILHDLFIDNLPLRLLNLSLSVPQTVGGAQLLQTGSFALPSTPSPVTLAIHPPNGFVLTLTFTGSTLTLNPVVSALGAILVPGLAPANVGNTVITLPLAIDTSMQANRSPITISRTADAIGVASPDNLVSAAGAVVANAVASPIKNAVATALQAAFPIVKDIQLPATGPCNIFPRFMKTKLLSGGAPAPDALGFFLALEQGTLNSGQCGTSAKCCAPDPADPGSACRCHQPWHGHAQEVCRVKMKGVVQNLPSALRHAMWEPGISPQRLPARVL
jgi:hypothetical protein